MYPPHLVQGGQNIYLWCQNIPTLHYLLVPLAHFALAIFIADTWQYLTHRLVHMNQYLYSEFDRSFGLPTVDKAGGRTYFESANAFLNMSQPISTLSITV